MNFHFRVLYTEHSNVEITKFKPRVIRGVAMKLPDWFYRATAS